MNVDVFLGIGPFNLIEVKALLQYDLMKGRMIK